MPAKVDAASAMELLEWLRREEVNERIRWPQDYVLSKSQENVEMYGQAIAVENQSIWHAFLAEPAGSSDPDVDVRYEPVSAPAKTADGERFMQLPLSELLFRTLLGQELFRSVLRCKGLTGIGDPVLPSRVVPGYTNGWGELHCGPGWIHVGGQFFCDDAAPVFAEFGEKATDWKYLARQWVWQDFPGTPWGADGR